jgi:hypothetical protein
VGGRHAGHRAAQGAWPAVGGSDLMRRDRIRGRANGHAAHPLQQQGPARRRPRHRLHTTALRRGCDAAAVP